MQGKIKHALLTTGLVLLTVYVLRQLPVTSTIVDTAIRG